MNKEQLKKLLKAATINILVWDLDLEERLNTLEEYPTITRDYYCGMLNAFRSIWIASGYDVNEMECIVDDTITLYHQTKNNTNYYICEPLEFI